MSLIGVAYLEHCWVASFHVTDSLTPEEGGHPLFLQCRVHPSLEWLGTEAHEQLYRNQHELGLSSCP